MKLYDEQIAHVKALLKGFDVTSLEQNTIWPDVGRHNLILRNEMAYELGGRELPAVSFLGVTSSGGLLLENDALLCGRDLDQITEDSPYARITILQVEDSFFQKKDLLYDSIKRFTNTRYQVNPKGYMNRISTGSNHEPVRVSKEALKEGLDFSAIAKLYADAYKKHPEVIRVQVAFVTDPNFPYGDLIRQIHRTDEITSALDHILRDIKMDCSSCKLQTICNEVEGMREMHFRDIEKKYAIM